MTNMPKLLSEGMALYPSSSLHRATSFFWAESRARSTEQHRLLFEMGVVILELHQTHGETPQAVDLKKCGHLAQYGLST